MPANAPDLGQVPVAVEQRVVVLDGLPLARRFDAAPLGGVGAPEADVSLEEQC